VTLGQGCSVWHVTAGQAWNSHHVTFAFKAAPLMRESPCYATVSFYYHTPLTIRVTVQFRLILTRIACCQSHALLEPPKTRRQAVAAMSSGRLPSPPPAPEIQLTADDEEVLHPHSHGHGELDQKTLEHNAELRIRRGTKAADLAAAGPLVPLSEACSLG